MSLVSVRHFREADFGGLMRLERIAFPVDAYTPQMIRKRIESYPEGFWIAEVGSEIVGYIAAWMLKGQARIDSMAVHPAQQNRGIGSRLLTKALKLFKSKGAHDVELEVRPSNGRAIAFYKKFGFHEEGVVPNYYPADSGDALLMRKVLNS